MTMTGLEMGGNLDDEFRRIIGILFHECMGEHSFEAPFSIHVTDAGGYTFSAAFVEDREQGRTRLYGIKAPEDENGDIAEHSLAFPLRVNASDHEGKTYRTIFQRIQ
jgi:hypothetical protein